MSDLEKRMATLEQENRIIQKQNLDILKKLEDFQPTLTALIQKLFQEQAMEKVQEALKTATEARDTNKELLEIMMQALKEWKLSPDQTKMKRLAVLVEKHGV